MSSEKEIKIGPYVRIKRPVEKRENRKTYPSCSDPSCSEHKVRSERKFCEVCEAKVTETEKVLITEHELVFWEFVKKLHETGVLDGEGNELKSEFQAFDKSYYIRGMKDDELIIFDESIQLEYPDRGVFEMEHFNSFVMLEKYINKNKPIFDALDELNGEKTATYHFGGLIYFS